jgi:hypothetical protein
MYNMPFKRQFKPGTMAHICNCNTQEVEARGWGVGGQPELHRELQVILGYTEKSCLKNKRGGVVLR